MTESALQEIRIKMGYTDGSKNCGNCQSFMEADLSGASDAKPQRCTANTFDIPVSKTGCCSFWKETVASSKPTL